MKRPPRQVRLEEETEAEVKKIAEVTSLPEIEIIRQTVKAGVAAIKENGYKLPLPLKLKVLEGETRAAPEPAPSSEKSPALRGLEIVKKHALAPRKTSPPE